MEEDNTTTLYFYPSRVKIIIISILVIVFLIGGTAMCFIAFKNEDYLISLLGGVIATFFVLMVPVIVKKIIKPLPFLVLTKKEIILNQGTKNPVSIKWKDVERYKIQGHHIGAKSFTSFTFLDFILYDEEKYKEQMSKTKPKLNGIGTIEGKPSTVSIFLDHIKIAEQDLLLYALDNITSPNFDVKNISKPKITERIDSFLAPFMNQINHEYFKKSYLLGLILTIFSMVLFYWGDKEMSSANYMFISFVFFPFAKLMFDAMIGFKLKSTIEIQSNTNKYVYQLIYIFSCFLLFLISPFVGPIGILFLITSALHRWIKRRQHNK